MGGELGKVVYEFGEKALAKLEPTMTKLASKADAAVGGKLGPAYVAGVTKKYSDLAENTATHLSKGFSLNSQLSRDSVSGRDLHEMLDDYSRQTSRNLAEITSHNTATGTKMSGADIAKAARNGHSFGPGQNMTGSYEAVFSKRNANLAAAIRGIVNEHGEEKAKNVVDALGSMFHEEMRDYGGGVFGTKLISDLKQSPITKDISFRPSDFKERGALEKQITSGASMALAVKAGLKHVSTPLNMLIGTSLSSVAKTLEYSFGSNYQAAKFQLQFFGVLGEIAAREADQAHKFENGLISKFIPGSIGRFVHDNFQIPLFDAIRHWSMTMSATQGRFIAEENTANLMSGNPQKIKQAMVELKQLGIDGRDVINRGGQLSHEEIGNAMFENANQRVFIDTARNRSQLATNTFMGRMFGMYHNYAAQQTNFIGRQFRKRIAAGDTVGLLKDMAILGTVFPAVGAGLNSLSQVWLGKDPTSIKEELHDVFDPHHVNFWKRVDAFSHTAGLGVMNSYIRASARNKLAAAMLGPVGNIVAETGQDIYKAAAGIGKKTKPGQVKPWEPLARDVLHDMPSLGIGGLIAAHMFPTQQTINAARPMTSKRLAAKQAAQKKKLMGK